eukprot:g1038.t1
MCYCNTCSFVNDKPLQRRILQMKSPGLSALFQDMPPCPGCGASHAYVLGVFDFSEEIRESLDNLHTSRCERSSAATMLQTYLRMCYFKRKYRKMKQEIAATKAENCSCATTIQRRYRGRLGRVRFRVYKSLGRIKRAHAVVMDRALTEEFEGGLAKVFWYSRKAELEVLFKDYKVLVRRTGGRPPTHKVARNIIEIARRVHTIECEYASRIQARIRGVLGRKFSRNYRQIQARILERYLTASLKIQRCARGWFGRVRSKKARGHHKAKLITAQYVKHREQKKQARDAKVWKQRILSAYRKERAEESMARMMGKTVFGAMDGRKIEAFRQSEYYDPRAGGVMREFYENEKAAMFARVDREFAGLERKDFLLRKYDRNDAFSKYFKSELPISEASGARWMIDLSKGRKTLARSPKSLGVTQGGSRALSTHFSRRYRQHGGGSGEVDEKRGRRK